MTLFLSPTDPLLNEESYEVCPCYILTEGVQSLIDTMLDLAITQEGITGLSAPQIDYEDRIILVGIDGRFKVMINPEILWNSTEEELWSERCYSSSNFSGLVPRAKEIVVKYYDRDGNILVEEYEGYLAGIIQHEVDHLDGIRFPDRIGENGKLHWVEEKDLIEYSKNKMNNWPTCPWEKWLEIRNANF